MEKVDDLIKLERIISNIEREAQKEIEDARALAHEELENFRREKEREFEEKKSELLKKHESEMERLKKLYSSRKRVLLRKYRSLLRSSIDEIARKTLLKLLEVPEYRKIFLKRALEKLLESAEENMILECPEGDLEIVKEMYGGKVRSGNVNGLSLVKGNLRIVYSIDEFVSECLDSIKDYISQKVGELG